MISQLIALLLLLLATAAFPFAVLIDTAATAARNVERGCEWDR